LVEFLQLGDKKESSVSHAKEFLWKQSTKVARIWLISLVSCGWSLAHTPQNW
jgi:hypothetical protein